MPDVFVAVFITGFVTIVAALIRTGGAIHDLIPWMGIGVVLSFCVIVVQAYVKYLKDKYDPTLALHYEKIFDSEMKSDRSMAARLLRDENHHLSEISNPEQKKKLEGIDPVLDLLDTLGFYMKGDQISDVVMHQHFYYWIRGYWLAARPYIEAWQSDPHEGPRWEHIEPIFDATCNVECSNGKTTKARERGINVAEFLEEEIGEDDLRNIKDVV